MDLLRKEKIKNKRKPDKNKIEFYTSDCSPYGITFGAWTVRWWKWCFSIQRDKNPTIDKTGIYANEKQSKPTWFLAGTWVSEERKYPHRKCSIPNGVSILFPIINCEENPLEYPNLRSKEEMKNRLLYDMGTVRDLKCLVNGEKIPPQLVHSDPEFFDITIRSDMSENKKGGNTLMTTSGYWIFLKSLPKGNHHIEFEGSYQYGKLYSGATYDISVNRGTDRNMLLSTNQISTGSDSK
jgi:hypothetical protein